MGCNIFVSQNGSEIEPFDSEMRKYEIGYGDWLLLKSQNYK